MLYLNLRCRDISTQSGSDESKGYAHMNLTGDFNGDVRVGFKNRRVSVILLGIALRNKRKPTRAGDAGVRRQKYASLPVCAPGSVIQLHQKLGKERSN